MTSMGSSAKKKISQLELRKYMHEHKFKGKLLTAPKKVESPLAKYNDQGQLTCILCKSVVRSEAVWNVHVNAKQHKENIELAKKLKERTNNFTTPLKRPLTPPHEPPTKKPKSILKNSAKSEILNDMLPQEIDPEGKGELPSDFFDKPEGERLKRNEQFPKSIKVLEKKENDQMQDDSSEVLPEGFFDDPKLDAKARNLEYKDPIQEEWEKFQKEIRDAEGKSAAIIAEDQEEATTERQIDEIDEQMKNLSKVLDLERKKVEVKSVINDFKTPTIEEDEDADEDFEEFLDWRSKNSFR